MPPPKLTLSEWADRKYQLTDATSSQIGPWNTYPYQREIMDALTDPNIESVTLMKSSRVGYTQIITADVCFHIAQDPCSMMVVQPTVEDAEGYSKEHIASAVNEVPGLLSLVRDGRSSSQTSTILRKIYPGGVLHLVGANSSRGFRRITAKRAYFDEIDEYPARGAGNEGDQLKLGETRTQDAWDRKLVYGSSPRLKGGRIERKFSESDQRYRFLPCPFCDHGQRLQWGSKDSDFGIKWPQDKPEDAYYLCEHCHQPIPYSKRAWMDSQGKWIATNPGARAVGFHIWAAYSYLPHAAWGVLAREFLECKDDPTLLQPFVNTVLGEPWEEQYRAVDGDSLTVRRERYPEREVVIESTGEVLAETMVPRDVAVMACGVDGQDDRLEAQMVGFGLGEEAWCLEYHVFYGDPSSKVLWDGLWEWMLAPRRMERGGVDYVRATAVDNGGHHGESAAAFCRPRFRYETPDGGRAFTFAIRGTTGEGSIWPVQANNRNKWKVPLWNIRVDPAKDLVAARLRATSKLEPGQGGPGMVHFPLAFGDSYFTGLTSEKSVPIRTTKTSGSHRQWKLKAEGRRNEPWDTLIYSYAALYGLRANGFDLNAEAERLPGRVAFEVKAEVPRTENLITRSNRVDRGADSWLGDTHGWMRR